MVNLREELKETITSFMCHGEIKDRDKVTKLNTVVQELDKLCLTRGMVKVICHHTVPYCISVLVGNNEESLTAQCSSLLKIIEDVTNLKLQHLKC